MTRVNLINDLRKSPLSIAELTDAFQLTLEEVSLLKAARRA